MTVQLTVGAITYRFQCHMQVMQAQANFVRVRVDRIDGLPPDEEPPQKQLLCVVRTLLKKIKQTVLVGDEVELSGIDWVDGRGAMLELLLHLFVHLFVHCAFSALLRIQPMCTYRTSTSQPYTMHASRVCALESFHGVSRLPIEGSPDSLPFHVCTVWRPPCLLIGIKHSPRFEK